MSNNTVIPNTLFALTATVVEDNITVVIAIAPTSELAHQWKDHFKQRPQWKDSVMTVEPASYYTVPPSTA